MNTIVQRLARLSGLIENARREVNVSMEPERIVGGMRLNFGDGSRIDLTADEVSKIAELSGYTRVPK